jgi:HK97 family phage prohead protease
MPTRDFTWKVKALDPQGTFSGVASTYSDTPDLQGDLILPGAYAQAIASQGAGYPLLFAHQQSQPLGVGKISDSREGLIVNGTLVMSDPNAQRAYAHLKAGSLKGLSIGYSVSPDKETFNRDGTRTLTEIRLHEISLTPVPADPGAQVTSVKSAAAVLRGLKSGDLGAEDRAVLVGALRSLLGGKNGLCECDCPECLEGNCADCSDEGCEDPACEGGMAETLSALRGLLAEMRRA